MGGEYIAYSIITAGKNVGSVRVVNRKTSERILIKVMNFLKYRYHKIAYFLLCNMGIFVFVDVLLFFSFIKKTPIYSSEIKISSIIYILISCENLSIM